MGSSREAVFAIIAAAGQGQRFGGPKLLAPLSGEPLLHHSVRALRSICDGLVVVAPADRAFDLEILPAELRGRPEVQVCAGGPTRQDSVRRGFEHLPAEATLVLVHDGARPHVGADLARRVLEAAQAHGAAVPLVPVEEAAYDLGPPLRALDRARLGLAQTPQAFRRGVLAAAYAWLNRQPGDPVFADEGGLVLASGQDVLGVPGERDNLKITRPADLDRLTPPRVGFGTDLHRLVAGRPLILCGVELPFERGLLGHSDGDAALHALADALLGAAGLPDIGREFPDTDPRWAGARSLDLLALVVLRVRAAGFRVASADLTIEAEAPRLAEHFAAMAKTVAPVLGVAPSALGLKAKTAEGLGPIGQGQAIAAQAVAVLVPSTQGLRHG